MELTQLGTLATNAINQVMGEDYIAALNDSNIVDVGKDIADSDRIDAVSRTLASMIGKMEITGDSYKKRLKSLFVDSWEWGGFLERVYADLEDIMDSPMWGLTDGADYSAIEHTYKAPSVSAKIFEEGKAFMTKLSTGVEQFKEAMRSMDDLNKYATMLQQNIRNTLDVAMDTLAHNLVSTAIAISDKALGNSIHLLTEAIALGILESGSTATDFMNSKEALVYACQRISNVKEYMRGVNKVLNNGNIATFCENADVIMLHDFKSAVDYIVRPTNYNDLVDITGETVVSWQGITSSNKKYAFDDLSKIMISADSNNKLGIGTSAVTIENAIALVKDRRSIGICPYKEKTTSSYTACADFWNQFTNILTNFIIDSNFSMVAFIID